MGDSMDLKEILKKLNDNNTNTIYLLSFLWLLIGVLYSPTLLFLETGHAKFGDSLFLACFTPVLLAMSFLFQEEFLLAGVVLGLYLYPMLFLNRIIKNNRTNNTTSEVILSILFLMVLFVLFLGSIPSKSGIDYRDYISHKIPHSLYWIVSALLILPIYEIIKKVLFEIKYYYFIVIFVVIYGYIGFLQYQKYSLSNEIERAKHFDAHTLYSVDFNPSSIPYVPLPDVKVDYDTVIELNQNPAVEPDDVDILQNYQMNGFLYRHYDVCFKYHCPEMIKQSLAKQPNYYLNINRTDTRIDYELLDENKASLWRASSHKIDTYDKFYNKTQEFHPDYHQMIRNKFKLYNPLLIGHDDIVIHYDEFNNNLTSEQRRASNELKDEQLTKIFSKNSPFHKSDKNSDCHFEVIGDNIHINGGIFKHTHFKDYTHYDLRNYHLWCSSDYYVLVIPKFDRIWGKEQYLFLIDRKTNTPLLKFEEFAHIFNKNIIPNPNNETFVNGNNKELLTTHPNGFEIKAISFKWVYYDESNKAWQVFDDKSQLPHNHFWPAVAVHTEFGDIFYRTQYSYL